MEPADSWKPSREKQGLIGISYLLGLGSGDEWKWIDGHWWQGLHSQSDELPPPFSAHSCVKWGVGFTFSFGFLLLSNNLKNHLKDELKSHHLSCRVGQESKFKSQNNFK